MKRSMIGKAFLGAVLGATMLVAGTASADGLVVKTSSLPAQAKKDLEGQIAKAKLTHKATFDAVRAPSGLDPAVYGKARNPVPTVARELRALGPDALLPMLEVLAFSAPAQKRTELELGSYKLGLIEAVGVLRDPRAMPVLRAAFEGESQSTAVARHAAEGLGKLCTDSELSILQKHAVKGDALAVGAVYGLGACKRPEAAKHLAGLLDATSDAAFAESVADALGKVGSSWAWSALERQAPDAAAKKAVQQKSEEARATAAKALAGVFLRLPATQSRVAKSLGMLEHPSIKKHLLDARTKADASGRQAIDALVTRLERRAAPAAP
jgi:HEAT repeat protein